MNARSTSFTLCLVLAAAAMPVAAAGEDEIAQMRQQLAALAARLDRLEAANAELEASNRELAASGRQQAEELATLRAAPPAAAPEPGWADRIRWEGDFRYRYENLAVEDAADRNRNRIRARAALVASLADDLEVGIGLATGGLDPVSANVTLGGGGGKKDLALDQAYFAWTALTDTRITGGKFKQFVYTAGKNQMLWDSDWRPEGLGATWDQGTFFAAGLGTWLEGDSSRGTSFSWIGQAGARFDLGEAVAMTAGLGYHQVDTRGRRAFFADGLFHGNSFDPATGTYLYDYAGLQAFAELRASLFGLPFMAYGEYVDNQDAPDDNTGWVFGINVGQAKAAGDWGFGWYYEELGRDAAFGLLADSDFGLGGTDVRGHALKGDYVLRSGISTAFTLYLTEIGDDRGVPRDVERLQLDLNFRY